MTDWIDVNERLPEDGVYVLLYTPKDDKIRIGWHVHPAWEMCREWMLITSMNSHQMLTRKPSHWMPLPQKPGRSEV